MAKIQLKRSVILDGTSAKEPTSSQMNFGEIAINYNKDDPSIFIKDSDDAIIRIAGVNAIGNKPSDIQGYPDILDGKGATLDNRYLKLGSGIGAQVVQSSSATDFNGGLKVSGGSTYLLELADSGATKFVVLPTGQVGIGVTTPTAPLQVNGQVIAGSFVGTGTAITTLDAGNISQGTLSTARMPATYTLAQQIAIGATGSLGNLVLYADKNIGLTASGTGSYITLTGNNGVGSYRFTKAGQSTIAGFLDFESLTADRTFTYPNISGTIALTTSTVDNSDKLDGQHGVYYTNYTDTAITNVVDSAPSTLNTLNKLAASLNDDANFSTTVTNSLATKLPLAGGTMTGNINMNGSDLIAAGNVGIGTSSPQAKLEITASAAGIATALVLNNYTGTGDGSAINAGRALVLGADYLNNSGGDTSYISFETDADERVRIASNGNVGVGTSSPQAKLDVQVGTQSGYGRIKLADNSTVSATVEAVRNSTDSTSVKAFEATTNDGNCFNVNYGGGAYFKGNVGINTISPQEKLDVNGGNLIVQNHIGNNIAVSTTVNNGNDSHFKFQKARGGVNGPTQISATDTLGEVEWYGYDGTGYNKASSITAQASTNTGDFDARLTYASNQHVFTTTGESLRIASNGDVGIGTSSPSQKLSVSGNGAFSGTVSSNGVVLTSDERFKTNITDANPQLADVTALGNSLRNWDWTEDAPIAKNDTRFLGLVAQEVETICPGIVTTIARTKDGAELTPEVVVPAVYETRTVPAVLDEEGEVIEPETTEQVLVTEEQITPATYEELDDSYKGIKNDVLVMKLLGAVAELSAKVAALEAS